MAKDPVCGMEFNESEAAAKAEHMGQTYYFCSSGCKTEFDKDPHKYMNHGSHSRHGSHGGGHGCC